MEVFILLLSLPKTADLRVDRRSRPGGQPQRHRWRGPPGPGTFSRSGHLMAVHDAHSFLWRCPISSDWTSGPEHFLHPYLNCWRNGRSIIRRQHWPYHRTTSHLLGISWLRRLHCLILRGSPMRGKKLRAPTGMSKRWAISSIGDFFRSLRTTRFVSQILRPELAAI
jgi:hypothetical protein